MPTLDRPRQPAGLREGGQFTATTRAEADLTLTAADRVRADRLLELTPATVVVLEAIRAAGGNAYLVGGCVRDRLLGHPAKDIDIEAYGLEPDRLRKVLSRVARVEEVGAAFSVLTVSRDGERLDVALPRRERRTGPGHRDFAVEVDPFCDVREASARRDFTVNALLYDPAADEIVDCWGGLGDLRDGVLRHTGPAFAEDPLRVLRGARFAARLGMRMHPATVDLARDLVPEFGSLSRERIWGEWSTMAATATRPSAWLDTLEQTGWLAHFPALADLRGVGQDDRWHPEGDVFEHTRQAADTAATLAEQHDLSGRDRAVVVLAAMLHDVGKATHTQQHPDGRITSHGHDTAGASTAATFLSDIGAPKEVRDLVAPIVAEHMVTAHGTAPTRQAVRRLARRLAPASIEQWALVVEADKRGRGAAARAGTTTAWLDIARAEGTQAAPVRRILTGADLIAAGWSPGPHFGPVLAASVSAQDESRFEDPAGARAWLASTYPTEPAG
ncbi:CCA tRNA nucleotidyltransferase [Pseudactinotalea terrae]|uniref:CCA tRNA nucleotidyltransferase n=1 Tax=Pseudactinotalea terrae TaxID=1743262 RepID=UPI0012E2CF0B|nr:CCA tRNA nucleotidyltransferase [Pseudactinotalea terrae]